MQIDRLIEYGKLLLAKNHVFMIDGSPGVGKSDAVKQMVKELDAEARAAALVKKEDPEAAGWDLILMHPVTASPTDFKGQPWAGTKDGMIVAEWLPYGDLYKLIKATRRTVCFIDDVGNDVPGSVQSAIAQLLLARCIGEHMVSPLVTFVLATNRRQDKAGVVGFRSHFLDRVRTVLHAEFSPDAWVTWAANHNMPLELLMFCKFKPTLFSEFKPSPELEKCGTPRSWAGVGELLNDGLDDQEGIFGAVGKGNASEFLAFRDVFMNIPDVTEILLNPDQSQVPDKPDVLYSLMGSLAAEATGKTMEALLTYIDRVPQREFAALAIKTISSFSKTEKGTEMQKKAEQALKSKAFTVWASNAKNRKLLGMAVK